MQDDGSRDPENRYLPKDLPPSTATQGPEVKSKKSWVIGVLTVIGILGLQFAIRFGSQEVEVYASKFQAWPPEFRESYVSTCEKSVREETAKETGMKFDTPKLETLLTEYSKGFCGCVFSEVEKQQILKTKYSDGRTPAQIVDENAVALDAWLKAEGNQVTDNCIKKYESVIEAVATEAASKTKR